MAYKKNTSPFGYVLSEDNFLSPIFFLRLLLAAALDRRPAGRARRVHLFWTRDPDPDVDYTIDIIMEYFLCFAHLYW